MAGAVLWLQVSVLCTLLWGLQPLRTVFSSKSAIDLSLSWLTLRLCFLPRGPPPPRPGLPICSGSAPESTPFQPTSSFLPYSFPVSHALDLWILIFLEAEGINWTRIEGRFELKNWNVLVCSLTFFLACLSPWGCLFLGRYTQGKQLLILGVFVCAREYHRGATFLSLSFPVVITYKEVAWLHSTL